ncbi:MAG: helix-hairpin-helix domain-containing protein [Bacteroidetes bacterium]|nr:helix-hairpin-helix domain-containing protein [Bacteroidota bacterium]
MNAILQYWTQHGPYKSMDELKNITILNEEILRKIAPYFEIRP